MINALKSFGIRALGVSISLTFGAVLIVTVLSALALFAPANGLPGDVQNWSRVDLQFIGYAALGGLMVDAIRAAAAACWQTTAGRGPISARSCGKTSPGTH